MPDDAVSFALKKTVKDFNGGSVVVGDKVVNLKTRLGSDGVITTSDAQEIQAFRGVDVLKEGSEDSLREDAPRHTPPTTSSVSADAGKEQ